MAATPHVLQRLKPSPAMCRPDCPLPAGLCTRHLVARCSSRSRPPSAPPWMPPRCCRSHAACSTWAPLPTSPGAAWTAATRPSARRCAWATWRWRSFSWLLAQVGGCQGRALAAAPARRQARGKRAAAALCGRMHRPKRTSHCCPPGQACLTAVPVRQAAGERLRFQCIRPNAPSFPQHCQ